jgi:two-component system, NtrC family, sensor kinase
MLTVGILVAGTVALSIAAAVLWRSTWRAVAARVERESRSRTLAALATMGAGVAHEINNPLTAILGAAQLLLADLPHDSPQRPLLRDLEKQAQRIRRIVAELQALADGDNGRERVRISITRLLEEAVAEAELEGGNLVLERHYDGSPEVRADAEMLRDALLELVTNARRAMPDGGRLVLRVAAAAPHLVVTVADSGHGIPAEMLPRIFEPFFTTKAEWGAPGLGLTRVHRIIEAHRGTIDVTSSPGAGTTFTVTLPAA